MTDWWMTRTPREKLLVGLAAAILAGALFYQFLLVPASARKTAAIADQERAVQTLARLDRIARLNAEGAAIRPAAAGSDVDTLRRTAVASAAEHGLTVTDSRLAAPGTFQIDLSRADPVSFFAWISRLETAQGLSVLATSLTAVEDGRVNAAVEFSTGPAQ
ncbi:MAG: type II secretion system protein GspM [Hyphomonas sp.]